MPHNDTKHVIRVQARFGPLWVFSDDLITNQILDFGAHTRPELAFFRTIIRPGDRVFDLGAHVGTFAVPIAQSVGPAGRVLAVEAAPQHAELLKRNLSANDLTHADVLQALVAPSARYDAQEVEGNSGATSFAESPLGESMSCATIDGLVDEWFSPDTIKIDIEGLEYWALSTSTFVASARPALYCEVSSAQLSRYGATVGDLDSHLRSLSYRFFRNGGERNAPNDDFTVRELSTLSAGGEFFDVLALPEGDQRLALLTKAISGI
jgi:FkbM family methyltransferase